MLAPIFLKLEKKYVNVKFVKINVDENQELSSKFNITSIPTVLFFKEGKKTSSFIGFRDESYIENEISKIN
jgi:thioredoxin 1